MALTPQQNELLIDTLALCEEHPAKLSEWEKEFIGDFNKKYDEHGDKTFMSAKQQVIVERIYNKLQKVK